MRYKSNKLTQNFLLLAMLSYKKFCYLKYKNSQNSILKKFLYY